MWRDRRWKGAVLREDFVALGKELFDFETLEVLAVWPAAGEVGLAADAVVERAGEGEIRGEQGLECGAVFGFVGRVAGADDFGGRFHGVCGCLLDDDAHPAIGHDDGRRR